MSKHAELMPATELAEDLEAVLAGPRTTDQPLITEEGSPLGRDAQRRGLRARRARTADLTIAGAR